MRKFFATSSIATLLLATFSSNVLAADAVLPDPNYPGGRALTYVIKAIGEQYLGLEIDTVRSNSMPVIFKAMDQGKGDIDIWPDVWMPNQKALVDEYVNEKGTVKLGSKPYLAMNGICVTRMTHDKYGIKSVYDLISPENAKLFDTNGDGKGEMWAGPSGWMSTNVEKVRARDYGYGEVFEMQVMEEAAALAGLDAAVTRSEPFVFYCYGPHHIFKLYDLVVLEEPPHDPEKFKMVQPSESTDWFKQSYVASAWSDTLVYVAYSKSLEERVPELAKLLDNIEFDADMVSAWVYEIGINKREPAEFANEWVSEHPDIVNKWLQF